MRGNSAGPSARETGDDRFPPAGEEIRYDDAGEEKTKKKKRTVTTSASQGD